jgi:hypothetical protein
MIFYCMREQTHSKKRISLFIAMVVETFGIEEFSPWTSFVNHIGALLRIGGIISFDVRLYCSLIFHMLIFY